MSGKATTTIRSTKIVPQRTKPRLEPVRLVPNETASNGHKPRLGWSITRARIQELRGIAMKAKVSWTPANDAAMTGALTPDTLLEILRLADHGLDAWPHLAR